MLRLRFMPGRNKSTGEIQMKADAEDGYIRVPHKSCVGMIKGDTTQFVCRDLFELVPRRESHPGIRVVALMRPLNKDEREQELKKRMRDIIAPARTKSAPVRHRSLNATNVGATTNKGLSAEIPNTGGTSRKSMQKRRRRERKSA